MGKYTVIECYGEFQVLQETLSDGSLAYGVRFRMGEQGVVIDCLSDRHAHILAKTMLDCTEGE